MTAQTPRMLPAIENGPTVVKVTYRGPTNSNGSRFGVSDLRSWRHSAPGDWITRPQSVTRHYDHSASNAKEAAIAASYPHPVSIAYGGEDPGHTFYIVDKAADKTNDSTSTGPNLPSAKTVTDVHSAYGVGAVLKVQRNAPDEFNDGIDRPVELVILPEGEEESGDTVAWNVALTADQWAALIAD